MNEVVVVTVTYNSNIFLQRCISHLLNQTMPIKKIIVVDNNSNEENKLLNEKLASDLVEILYLNENTGGAGGFEYGTKYAVKNYNFDWLWIMDDDAFPKEDCLENLLRYTNYENIGCICPAIFGNELQKFQVFHHKKINNKFKDVPRYSTYEEFPDAFEIDANAFVGPLIKKEVVDKIGYPDGSLFIYGDDTEYTYRLTRLFKMIVVKNAIINHRDIIVDSKVLNPNAWWKDYYMYRNRFLFFKKYCSSKFKLLIMNMSLTLHIYARIISTLIKPKFKGYRKVKISLYRKAIKDGKKSISGKRINPTEFIKSLEKR